MTARVLTKDVECTAYGWRAVVTDDAAGMMGCWYGTRAECEALDPAKVDLYIVERFDEPDPFDLACERRYDGSGS